MCIESVYKDGSLHFAFIDTETYLHQPFVIEGDAYREDIVQQNQSNSAQAPADELDRARHTGPLPGSAVQRRRLLQRGHLQAGPAPQPNTHNALLQEEEERARERERERLGFCSPF